MLHHKRSQWGNNQRSAIAPLDHNEWMLMSAELIPTVWPRMLHVKRNCCVSSFVVRVCGAILKYWYKGVVGCA
jgi:hypothetical protein